MPSLLANFASVTSATANPDVAFILLVLGCIGIYAEFSSPGAYLPGALGFALVLIGLNALAAYPISWVGALLIVFAIVLFILEAKFVTHGLLTFAGAVAMTIGAMHLVNSGVPEVRIHAGTAIAASVPFALISAFLFSIAARARRNKVVTGAEGMLGLDAVAVGNLSPAGTVAVRGEYWSALAPGEVPAGAHVRVTGLRGLTLLVEPTEEKR